MITITENIKENIIVNPESNYVETPDIETSSLDYSNRFRGDVGKWFLRIQEKATLKMLAEWPNATVLDVGGGHGQLTEPLMQNGYIVTVLGSSIECKNRIQEYVKEGKCKFKIGNILELPFDDKSFDAVISFRLIPHVAQWPKLTSELTRVARKVVVIDYPSLRSINYFTPMLFNLKKKMEGNTRHYKSFYEKELVQRFKQHGFLCAARYPEFFLPMVFHRVLKLPVISVFLESVFRGLGFTALFGSPLILKLICEDGALK